jgi:hypothetical protein
LIWKHKHYPSHGRPQIFSTGWQNLPGGQEFPLSGFRFHHTFSPSEKTPAYGIRQKICLLISPTMLKANNTDQNSLNHLPKKASNFARKKMQKKLFKSTTDEHKPTNVS